MANEKRLIYMDDTMNRLRAYADRKHQAGHTELANGILKAVNYIHNEISRVDAVEVKHGRWHDNPGVFGYICSQCNKVIVPEYFDGVMNYCPNCGADMRERETNDN